MKRNTWIGLGVGVAMMTGAAVAQIRQGADVVIHDTDAASFGVFQAVREAGYVTHLGITANGDTDAVREVVRSGAYASGQAMVNALNPSAGWPGHVPSDAHDFSGLIADAITHDVGVIVIRSLEAGALAALDGRHVNAGHPGGIAGEDYATDLSRARRLASLTDVLGLEGPGELSVRLAQSTPGVGTEIGRAHV